MVIICVYFTAHHRSCAFFSCGNFVSRETFTHQRRTLNCCVLILVTEGTLNITSGGKEYAVSKGEYILLPADEEHFGHAPSDGRLSYLWAHFKPIVPFEIYESGVTESFEIAIPEYGSVPNSRCEMLFRQLLDFSRREDLYSEALPACSMSLLLMELTQEHIDDLNKIKKNISPNNIRTGMDKIQLPQAAFRLGYCSRISLQHRIFFRTFQKGNRYAPYRLP